MPAISLNMLETYTLMAIGEEIVPRANFFRDRYFPTDAGDLFASDKVLTEYRKGDRKMASFVSPRVGDIPMDRRGYEIHEYQPAFIAPSRPLTADDSLPDDRLALASLDRNAVAARQRVDDFKAHVVPRVLVFAAGIAQTDDYVHKPSKAKSL